MICKKYKDKLKELIGEYKKKIRDLKYVNSLTENKELTHKNKNKNNINTNPQNENINNLNLKQNNINEKEKEKDTLCIRDVQFINIKCHKCEKKNDINIFQCVCCENYYLCQDCYNENNDKTLCFHKHRFLYFFEIKFPKELMKKINKKRKVDKNYNEVINRFKLL